MSELSHYGKLGMKWGQRRANKRADIATKDQALLESRARFDDYQKRLASARTAYNSATTAAGRKQAEKTLAKLGKERFSPQGTQDAKNFYNRVPTSKEKRQRRLILAGAAALGIGVSFLVTDWENF